MDYTLLTSLSSVGIYGKGLSAPSPSSNLSASAPPFTIGRSVPYTATDPFVSSNGNSYDSPVQYAVSDPPVSLAVELPNASTGYSAADTFYGSVGGAAAPPYAYPINSSGHNGFSLYSDPNSDFDSIPPSNPAAEYSCWNSLGTSFSPYMYGGQCSDGVTSNTVEAGTYYSSYVSPSTANQVVPSRVSACGPLATFSVPPLNGPFLGEYYPNLTVFRDTVNGGSSIWKMSDLEGAALKDSPYPFYSTGGTTVDSSTSWNYASPGNSASEALRTYEETTPKIGIHDKDKSFTSASTGQSDGGNFLGKNPTCMLPTHSRNKIVSSTPVAPEPVWPAQLLKPQTNHWDIQVGQSNSLCKWTSQPDSSLDGNESSFHSIIESPSDCSGIPHINFAQCYAANDASAINSSSPLLSSRGTDQFETPQMDRHMERNGQIVAASSSTCNQELSSFKKLLNSVGDEAHGFQEPFGNRDSFKVGFNIDGPVQSVHHFSENSDQLNPAIDSPCWKGISFRNVSPFGASEVVGTQLVNETETSSSLNSQGPKFSPLISGNAVGDSSKKSNERAEFRENEHVDDVTASVWTWNSITESLPKKLQPYDAKKPDSYPSQKDLDCFAFSSENPVTESLPKKHQPYDAKKPDSYPSQKDLGCFAFSSDNLKYINGEYITRGYLSGSGCESSDLKQVLGNGVLAAEKANTVVDAVRDARRETIDDFKDNSSHHPFGSSDSLLSSSLPVTDISAMLCKMDVKDSVPDIYVQELLKTMHNLSQLLLVHCSSNTCGIKEEDNNRLKQVINNLIICTQESSKKPATSQHNEKLQEVDRNQDVKLKKASVSDDVDQLNDHHSNEENKNYVNFGSQDLKLHSVPVTCSNDDMVDVDKITQAIKKVLVENLVEEETHAPSVFYRNLWLEAEAELCSLNFRARYNRIKVELQKCQLNETEDVSSLERLQRSAESSKSMAEKCAFENGSNISTKYTPFLVSNRHVDDAMDKLSTLRGAVSQSLADCIPDVAMSRSKFSNLYSENENEQETTGHQHSDSSHPEFLSKSTECHPDDVMARFHILKRSVPDLDLSKVNVSAYLSRENQMAMETTGPAISSMSHHDSSVLNTSCHADDVMTRFNILKWRENKSVYEDSPDSNLSSPNVIQTASFTGSYPTSDIRSKRCLDDSIQADLSVSVDTHDISHHSLPPKDTSSLQDDVMARLKILTSCCGESVSKGTPNQKAVQSTEGGRTHVSHYSSPAMDTSSLTDDIKDRILNKADELQKKLNDCSTADVGHCGSAIETTGGSVHDILTRAHILMSRLDNAVAESIPDIHENSSFVDFSYLNNVEEVSPYLEDRGQDWTDTVLLLDNPSLESDMNPAFPNLSPGSPKNNITLKDTQCNVEDDPGTQSRMSDIPDQNSFGSNISSLSDWVDLGKEDLPGQKV